MDIKLKYIGEGAFITGIPAKDLVVQTKVEAAALVKSGLYRRVKASKPKQENVKEGQDGSTK